MMVPHMLCNGTADTGAHYVFLLLIHSTDQQILINKSRKFDSCQAKWNSKNITALYTKSQILYPYLETTL